MAKTLHINDAEDIDLNQNGEMRNLLLIVLLIFSILVFMWIQDSFEVEYETDRNWLSSTISNSSNIRNMVRLYNKNLCLNFMEHLLWDKVKRFPTPTMAIVSDELILGQIFVPIINGLHRTSSELHVSSGSNRYLGKDNIIRFSFVPSETKIKSCLEITTCFTQKKDFIEIYGNFPKEAGWLAKTSCPVVRNPLPGDLHTHSYKIYIPQEDFNKNGMYILTQWHGTPDSTLIKDQYGCIGQIPIEDLYKVCSKGQCKKGKIYDQNSQFIGLNYCQGGYPTLTFSLENKHFQIVARSDEKLLIDKGGCPAVNESTICPDHPRQQHHVIWKLPVEKFKFDEWVEFEWKIKWSEYNSATGKYTTPGTRTTDAWIRIWIDNQKIVDWIGPCGRNDIDRTPYFKAGIYNPHGNIRPIRFYFREYTHHHELMKKNMTEILRISDTKDSDINQNELVNESNYEFKVKPTASKNKCKLRAKVDLV